MIGQLCPLVGTITAMGQRSVPAAGAPPAFGGSSLGSGIQHYWSANGASTSPGASYYGNDSVPAGFALTKVGNGPSVTEGKSSNGWMTSTTGGSFSDSTTGMRQSGDFTVSVWFRDGVNPPSQNQDLLEVVGDYRLRMSSFGLLATVFDSVAGSVQAFKSSSTTYALYVMSYNSATRVVTLYKNDDAGSSSAALANGLRQASVTLNVAEADSDRHRIDELAVWGRLLTPAERTELYNAGVGLFY